MKIIGITGPIGSGKSTVTRILLKSVGVKVIDADQVSRKVVETNSKAFEELVNCFGRGILDQTGKLDRRKLGDIVFNDSEKLKLLNSIMHKYIVNSIIMEIDGERKAAGVQILILECPIPVGHGFMDIVDEVWVVTAERETRIRRIMERNDFNRDEAVMRINSQMDEEEYLKIADRIICNNGDTSLLENKINELIKF